MTNQERPAVAEALARLAGGGADATRVADAVAATWQQIESALTPIIGAHGVTALYRRSLHLTLRAHPWLADDPADDPLAMNLGTLRAALAGRSADDAVAAGDTLLQTFHDLLASLIGAPLSRRLLHFMWPPFEPAAGIRPTPS